MSAVPELTVIIYKIKKDRNIGQIVRSAAAFGASRVILCGDVHKRPSQTQLNQKQKTRFRKHWVSVPWQRADAKVLTQMYQESGITFLRYDTLSECHQALKSEDVQIIGGCLFCFVL